MIGSLERLAQWPRLFLVLLLGASAVGLAPGSQGRNPERPIPFHVQDLLRRAQALQKAAESLETLLDGWTSGRLDDERFRTYFLERAELLSQLSKDIESDRDLRRLSEIKKSPSKKDDRQEPSAPTTPEEALLMSREAAQLASGIKDQVAGIAGDANTFEVRVDELAKPDPVLLCKRLRALAERLEESAREGRLRRQ